MEHPSQLQHGLVDAESDKQLDECLLKLGKHWNELEKTYNSPTFSHLLFEALSCCNCQLHASRNLPKCWFRCPPLLRYTNEVELKNKIFKDEVEPKCSGV